MAQSKIYDPLFHIFTHETRNTNILFSFVAFALLVVSLVQICETKQNTEFICYHIPVMAYGARICSSLKCCSFASSSTFWLVINWPFKHFSTFINRMLMYSARFYWSHRYHGNTELFSDSSPVFLFMIE